MENYCCQFDSDTRWKQVEIKITKSVGVSQLAFFKNLTMKISHFLICLIPFNVILRTRGF